MGNYKAAYRKSTRLTGTDLARLGGYTAAVAAGSTLAMTEELHAGSTINLDTAAGSTVTLPASTGQGAIYRFRVSVLATSNSHIVKVANSSDVLRGLVFVSDDTTDTVVAFRALAASDTITLNRSTTGSVTLGEFIEIIDIAANTFQVVGFTSATGTPVTPFSATV
jgi:hypothetical protein